MTDTGQGLAPVEERSDRIRAWAMAVTRRVDAVSDAIDAGRPADEVARLKNDLAAATVGLDTALQHAMGVVTTMRGIQERLAAFLQELATLGMDVSMLDLQLHQAAMDVTGQSDRIAQLDRLIDALDVVLTTAGQLLADLNAPPSPPPAPPGLRFGPMPTASPDQPMQSNIGERRAHG
jgi:septal ring factor EnvC (AmiA/AmiB activator)